MGELPSQILVIIIKIIFKHIGTIIHDNENFPQTLKS